MIIVFVLISTEEAKHRYMYLMHYLMLGMSLMVKRSSLFFHKRWYHMNQKCVS